MKQGDILTEDFQSCIFGTQYRLVERTPEGGWVCEYIADSREVEDAIIAYYATNEREGYSFDNTVERLAEELERRAARVGERFVTRFVSRAQWAEMF